MNRRGFLAGILAAGAAPAFVGSSVLMPVRKIILPESGPRGWILHETQSVVIANPRSLQKAGITVREVDLSGVIRPQETAQSIVVSSKERGRVPADMIYTHSNRQGFSLESFKWS